MQQLRTVWYPIPVLSEPVWSFCLQIQMYSHLWTEQESSLKQYHCSISNQSQVYYTVLWNLVIENITGSVLILWMKNKNIISDNINHFVKTNDKIEWKCLAFTQLSQSDQNEVQNQILFWLWIFRCNLDYFSFVPRQFKTTC